MLILNLIFIANQEIVHTWFVDRVLPMLLNSLFPSALVFPLLLLPCLLFCALPLWWTISTVSSRNAFRFFFGFLPYRKLHQRFSKFRFPSFLPFFPIVSCIWKRKSSSSILITNLLGYRRIFTVRLSPQWWKRVKVHRWRGQNRIP